ncbi:hypothetical protein [Mycobacterium sp.]
MDDRIASQRPRGIRAFMERSDVASRGAAPASTAPHDGGAATTLEAQEKS